jgi:GcrA cell cycle regulator
MDTIWTTDRIEQLKRLHADGLSARRIAVEMNCGLTRCAVCGKINRLKLMLPVGMKAAPSGRPASRNKKAALPSGRRNPSHNILAAIAIARSEPGLSERLKGDVPDGTGIKLHELTKFTCRFPIGDPREPGFEFCGARAVPGLPYCAGHCRRAFQLPNST